MRSAGGRPGGTAADPGRAGRRPDQLHRAGRGLRPDPLHHLAPARGARGQPPARTRRRAARSRPVRCSRSTPRGTTCRPSWRGWPSRSCARSAPRPARRSTSRCRAARPSSRSRRSTRPTCSAHGTGCRSTSRRTARRWARCSMPMTPLDLPVGRPRAAHRALARDQRTRCAPRSRRSGASVTRVTRGELEIGLDAAAVPVRGPDGAVVAALGVSGPSTRLEDKLDELGRQLKKHGSALSQLLRPRMRTKGVA